MKFSLSPLVRENILRLAPYASARHEFEGEADVFLDANENPFDTDFNRYPDPLQHAVKQHLSVLKNVPTENIFLGNGSDEAIDLLIRIFCEPRKDHIIILPPTYGMYKVSASIADVALRTVSLSSNFQPDVSAILNAADAHSKLLFICSPNNPTANSFDSTLVETLIQQFQGIVVVDEAYIDFAEQASFTSLLEKYPNLVVLQTFSKAWGLAGIRLGIAYASTAIIQLFNKVKPPYNVNSLTQDTALRALQNPSLQQEQVQEILSERAYLAEQLAAFPFVQHIYPSDTNFLLVRVDTADELYRFLVEEKIIVRNRSKVHLCAGCLRFTVGTKAENARLLKALTSYA